MGDKNLFVLLDSGLGGWDRPGWHVSDGGSARGFQPLLAGRLISCAVGTFLQATHAKLEKQRFYWAPPVGEKFTKPHTQDTHFPACTVHFNKKFQKAIIFL